MSVRSTQEYGEHSCTDHRRTLYNVASSRMYPFECDRSLRSHHGRSDPLRQNLGVPRRPRELTGLPAYIDRQLVHEVTSPQAFEGLKLSGRRPRRPGATLAVPDHNVPTTDRTVGIADPLSAKQIQTLEENCREFGITLFGMNDIRQGIVHVIGPEQGFTLPGTTIVCGDSHTSTHGAFGALAFGIGTSEVEHVLATQCLVQKRPTTMEVRVDGMLSDRCSAKDVILAIIGKIGTARTGYVIEYTGSAIAPSDGRAHDIPTCRSRAARAPGWSNRTRHHRLYQGTSLARRERCSSRPCKSGSTSRRCERDTI